MVGGFINFHGAVVEVTPEEAEGSGCFGSDVFYVRLPLKLALLDSQILGTVYHLKNMTIDHIPCMLSQDGGPCWCIF